MPRQVERWHQCRRWRELLGTCPYTGQRIHDNEIPKRGSDISLPRRPPGARPSPSFPKLPGFRIGWEELIKLGEDEVGDPKDKEKLLWNPPGPRLPEIRRPKPNGGGEPSSSGTTVPLPKPKKPPGKPSSGRFAGSLLKREAEVYTTERLKLRIKRRKDAQEESERNRRKQNKKERIMIPQTAIARREPLQMKGPKKAVPGGNRGWRYAIGGAAAGLTTAAIYQLNRNMGGGGGQFFQSRPGQALATAN